MATRAVSPHYTYQRQTSFEDADVSVIAVYKTLVHHRHRQVIAIAIAIAVLNP